ncbi:MAG: NAD(P)-dependent oxidoreductase [Acidimicrobiales bacterium]|nr:NAD(P)-dependent oxidoreductase [Acidimicrobiales bacterium]
MTDPATPAPTVAVIGLGLMGGNIAARLVERGFTVHGFDPRPDARAAARTAGVLVGDRAADAVADASLVCTSLPDGAVVHTAWCGPDGIVAHAAPATMLVELSTIDPATMREVGERARAAGLRPIDAPVSGGPVEARAGTLSLIVGGRDDDVAAASPVLDALGRVARTGDIGTGKVVKLVNNLMSMGNVAVAAEAFALGEAAGVDPDTLYAVLSGAGGRSHHFTKRFPKARAGDFEPGFTVALGEKDVALGAALGRQLGLPMPAAAAVRELFGVAKAEGLAERDVVSLLQLYRRWSGERA